MEGLKGGLVTNPGAVAEVNENRAELILPKSAGSRVDSE